MIELYKLLKFVSCIMQESAIVNEHVLSFVAGAFQYLIYQQFNVLPNYEISKDTNEVIVYLQVSEEEALKIVLKVEGKEPQVIMSIVKYP